MGFTAQRPPTSRSTVDPTGGGQEGELRFVDDATTGETKAIWRYNGSAWIKKADTTAPIITDAQQPTRPDAATLSDNTLYIHLASGEVDIVSGGAWVENVGRGGINFGPPANMPDPSTINQGSLFYVSEQATVSVPLGLYVVIGGVWVGVSTTGAPQTKLIALDLSGTLSVNQASRAFRPPTGGTLVSVHADVNVASTDSPTGTPLIFDLEANGASVFTDTSLRPTVPVDAAVGTATIPNTTTFSAFQPLVAKVKQIGSTASPFPVFKQYLNPSAPAVITAAGGYSVTRISGIAVGDLQVVVLRSDPSTITWTAPSGVGWVQWGRVALNVAALGSLTAFYRLDDGTSGPWTFTPSASTTANSDFRFWVSNVNQTTPVDTASTGTGKSQSYTPATSDLTFGGLTTTVNNVMEIALMRTNATRTFNPGPVDVGYTIVNGFSASTLASVNIGWKNQATAGATASVPVTPNTTTQALLHRIPIVGAGATATRLGKDARVYVRYTESS